jgi:hypothetical protein
MKTGPDALGTAENESWSAKHENGTRRPRYRTPRHVLRARTPRHVFRGIGGVGSRFHVLCARAHFRRYRGSRVPFSSFARPDSFSVVPRSSGSVFMFYAPELIFRGTTGIVSRFHVLRSRTRFWRYRGRRVPFSCSSCPDSFLAVPGASGPVFKFCAPGHTLAAASASGHVFMFCAPRLVTAVPRATGPVLMFYTPGLVFGGSKVVRSRFHVFRSRSCFRRYRGRWVPFSCFARPDTFSVVPRALGPVFMFCTPILIFGCTEVVRFSFHVLRSRTRFRRYRGRPVLFPCFVFPDSFSTVPSVSGPVLIFYAPELVFGGT